VSVRCLYLDLDGTLLGRGASLLHDGEGRVSGQGMRAIEACLRAEVEVVLMSGRRRAQVAEDARLLGQSAYIFEAGACVVLGAGQLAPASVATGASSNAAASSTVASTASSNAASSSVATTASSNAAAASSSASTNTPSAIGSSGASAGGLTASSARRGGAPAGGEEHWLTGAMVPGELTIAEQIERSGAPRMLLEHYEGRLEYHEPWHMDREVSHLFRGLVDAREVDALLAERGHEHLRLVDNGVVQRRSPALAGLPHVRGYHLVPAGASKAAAVAFHRQVRGYAREETFAVGDSREDLACAEHVGTLWLVGNAVERDPSIRQAAAAHDNVRVAEAGHGAGVYEAVVSTLVTR
jgi:hydroxymethylpyrimidine pyrophosphatase-like HAD family hydrolase